MENNQRTTLGTRDSKSTENQAENKVLKPQFDSLESPETMLNHVKKLTEANSTEHGVILGELLDQFEPIDFQNLAFPESQKIIEKIKHLRNSYQNPDGSLKEGSEFNVIRDEIKSLEKRLNGMRVTEKHLLILTIENVQKVASSNSWGLCKNHDMIYLYNGSFWSEIDKESFQKFLGEAAEKMGVAKFTSKFYKFRENLFKQFLATSYLPTPEVDSNTVLINLQNGTFEVRGEERVLRPFNSSDFLTYQLPFEFDPEAKAPLFQKYLNRVLPDQDKQKVLAEFLGFVFIKNGSPILKEEKALILYGTGANGKSVFFEVVSALLGQENTCNYTLQSLTNETGYHRAKLANKLVNYASEINGKLESAMFKQLVSGEPVEARLPYGQPFTLQHYAKLIFNSNELPKDVEHTNAYFRRFLIIPFDVTIPKEEQDKQLHSKIIESELSGVFNWVLDGLKRLLEQRRFTDCEAVQKAVERYRSESDSVKMFLEESSYETSPNKYTLIKDLYKNYREYCVEDGFRPVSKTNFKKRLESISVLVEKKREGNVAYVTDPNFPF